MAAKSFLLMEDDYRQEGQQFEAQPKTFVKHFLHSSDAALTYLDELEPQGLLELVSSQQGDTAGLSEGPLLLLSPLSYLHA